MGYTHLSKLQRCELEILRRKGHSLRDIAKVLGVHHGTLSRELKRNSMRSNNAYIAEKANRKAYLKRKYSKYEGMKINRNSFLFNYVASNLQEGWTPEEISGRLKFEHGIIFGFSSIYKWIYSVHGLSYSQYLPSGRDHIKRRRKRKSNRYRIPDRISIHHRPGEINERKRLGDFEGDLLGKPKHTKHALVAASDRRSRYFIAKRVSSVKMTIKAFKSILPENSLSLTLDNGKENSGHKSIGVQTYFCDPYSAWQKGTIENTFQRLRRYIPKKSNLEDFSDEYIAFIVNRMNNTPRKCLGYRTPAEVFKEHFAPLLNSSFSLPSGGALRGTM